MSVEAPIDPPDEGTPYDSMWECPSCEQITTNTCWVEVTGRYSAIVDTQCDACDYVQTEYDDTYGYDG